MNKSKIEYCDYTWNPLVGCKGPANNGVLCSYCYAKRIAERFRGSKAFPNGFEPTWHPERLSQPAKVKTPSRIFVGSMTDMGAPWVKREWMEAVLDVVRSCQQHTFIFLTKQPNGFAGYKWPDNCWVGFTFTGRGPSLDPSYIPLKWRVEATVRFVSLEPLLGGVLFNVLFGDKPDRPCWLDWIIIGAQTGSRAIEPKREWIARWLDIANSRDVPIFMKDNLRKHWDSEWRREFPQ